MPIVFREYVSGEIDQISALLDLVFPGHPMKPGDFRRLEGGNFTIAVAENEGRIVGAIPMMKRQYRVAPGAVLDAWIQFRVGVSDACRGMGIGKGLQDAASAFLKGRGDMILIVSTSENAVRPYHFYRTNGFHDVSYRKRFVFPPGPVKTFPDVSCLSEEDFFKKSEVWLDIFNQCYAGQGGYAVRTADFIAENVKIFWKGGGLEFFYRGLGRNGRDIGYLIAAGKKDNNRQVMEIAVRDGNIEGAAKLLAAARPAEFSLSITTTQNSLLANAARLLGLENPTRYKFSNASIVKILDIESIGRKIWVDVPALKNTEVGVWTPEREGVFRRPLGIADRKIVIELKEDMLARLLTRRLDIAVAVREERITLAGDRPGDVEALTAALPPASWTYHEIEGL